MKEWIPTFESWFNSHSQIETLVNWAIDNTDLWLKPDLKEFEKSKDRFDLIYQNLEDMFQFFYGIEVPEIVEQSVEEIVDKVVVGLENKLKLDHQYATSAPDTAPIPTDNEYDHIDEILRKVNGKWQVRTKNGKRRLGTHSSKKKAIKQLQAIEISKAKHAIHEKAKLKK